MNILTFAVVVCISTTAAIFVIIHQNNLASLPPQPVIHFYDFRFGPMTMFDYNCARCHGGFGSMYQPSFYRLSKDQLHDQDNKMMHEQAVMTPTDEEIHAMTDYQFSIQKNIPFVSVTNATLFLAGNTDELKGEATPGTKVTIIKDQTVYETKVKRKYRWAITPPPPPFTIQAEYEDYIFTHAFQAE